MTHAQMVERAVRWLRLYRCGVVLSEQACVSGEMPDAIGWKRANHSVLVECKLTRADFLADRTKPFRQQPEQGVGSERFYLTPPALVKLEELPAGWGLLEFRRGRIEVVRASAKNLRSRTGTAMAKHRPRHRDLGPIHLRLDYQYAGGRGQKPRCTHRTTEIGRAH